MCAKWPIHSFIDTIVESNMRLNLLTLISRTTEVMSQSMIKGMQVPIWAVTLTIIVKLKQLIATHFYYEIIK